MTKTPWAVCCRQTKKGLWPTRDPVQAFQSFPNLVPEGIGGLPPFLTIGATVEGEPFPLLRDGSSFFLPTLGNFHVQLVESRNEPAAGRFVDSGESEIAVRAASVRRAPVLTIREEGRATDSERRQ